jgi:predicted transposase YdaD
MLKEWDIVQEWIKEGELEGELKGKLEGKLELISKFLKTRFSLESLKLQKKLNSITNMEVLDEISGRLFTSKSIEEAKAIIEEAIEIQEKIESEK